MKLFRSKLFRLPQNRTFDYRPRYYDEEEERKQERLGEKKIKMEKGAFFRQSKNRSRIVGSFSGEENAYSRNYTSSSAQVIRILLLIVMLSIPVLYILDKMSAAVAIPALLILLVVFVSRVNKM